VLDETGIGVRDKASELLAEGGVDALLDEIPTMRADRAKHISYDVLLDRAALTPELLVRTAAQALEQLETEHILADVLTRLADAGWLPSLAADDYFAAVRSLPREHRRQRLLDLAIEAEGVPPSLVAGYFGVLDTFPSEHRRAHFIDLLLERRDSLDSLMLVLDALDLLPSEHRRHAVLDRLVPRLADDQEGTAAYFDTLGSIPSEHRRDQLLHRLLAQSDEWLVDNAELFLDALAELPSEHRRDALLRMLLPRFRRHDRLLLGLLDGVGSLPAEHRVAPSSTRCSPIATSAETSSGRCSASPKSEYRAPTVGARWWSGSPTACWGRETCWLSRARAAPGRSAPTRPDRL
jgi:hypothetical protein